MDSIGTRVRQLISRSGALNDTRQNESRNTQDKGGYNVQGTDISFTSPNTIASAGNAFPTGLKAGDMITITGSGANDRQWLIATSAAGSLTVLPAQIQSAVAGPLIDIRTS